MKGRGHMAKKVKFPLRMADGTNVRTLEELREHFDFNSVLSYYVDGKLKEWLDNRGYENESDKLSLLDSDSDEFNLYLCELLGVECSHIAEVDIEEIAARNARISKLKQITDDDEIIKNVDKIAFTQDELNKLLESGTSTIYLCGTNLNINVKKENVTYIGINKPIVNIESKEVVDFNAKKIIFDDVILCDSYMKLLDDYKAIYSFGNIYESNGWIYYLCNNHIFRMRLNGSDKMSLIEIIDSFSLKCHFIKYQIYKNWLYYAERTYKSISDSGQVHLYRYSLDGKKREKCGVWSTRIDSFIVYNDRLYYSAGGYGHIFCSRLDGSNETQIAEMSNFKALSIYKDWIFYIDNNKYLYKVKINGTDNSKLCNITNDFFFIDNDWIYYHYNGSLCRINIDNSLNEECQRISDDYFSEHPYYIYQNKLYCTPHLSSLYIYSINDAVENRIFFKEMINQFKDINTYSLNPYLFFYDEYLYITYYKDRKYITIKCTLDVKKIEELTY